MPKKTEIDHYSDKEALDFHIKGKSGKIEIGSSKPQEHALSLLRIHLSLPEVTKICFVG